MPESIPRGPFDQGLFLTHYNKGEEFFKEGRLEDAEHQLEEAYLLRPRDVRVLNLLGLVYYRQEKYPKAEEVYRKLIAESPEAHTLYLNLGLIYVKLDRLPDAEMAFLKALELGKGKNPKISFYLGSIYERTRRYKDAIYQYRQAGASVMVARLQGRMRGPETDTPPAPDGTKPSIILPEAAQEPAAEARPEEPPEGPAADTRPPGTVAIPREVFDPHPEDEAPEPTPEDEAALAPPKTVEPVSPQLMSDGGPTSLNETARFQVFDDTLPPGAQQAPVRPGTEPPGTRPPETQPPGTRPPETQPPGTKPPETQAPATSLEDTDPGLPQNREPFRCVEKGLLEADFSGKVFIKQGTIYSYSGNLTFWVKEKRAKGLPALVIVTGTGRLLLTDQEREITLMRVEKEAIFVEPSHLLACEEGLQPRYVSFGKGEAAVEVVVLEGRGLVALSVASKPLPLTVRPALPVSVPASSIIMWTGQLVPTLVDDPQVYAVVRPAGEGDALLRLEGTGRVLAEQAT